MKKLLILITAIVIPQLLWPLAIYDVTHNHIVSNNLKDFLPFIFSVLAMLAVIVAAIVKIMPPKDDSPYTKKRVDIIVNAILSFGLSCFGFFVVAYVIFY